MMNRYQHGAVFPTIKSRIQTQHTPRSPSHLFLMNAAYLSILDQVIQSSPYTTAAIVCGIKASMADFIAQKRQLRKRNQSTIGTTGSTSTTTSTTNNNIRNEGLSKQNDEITTPPTTTTTTKTVKTDIPRNIAFLLYGALYQGMGQEYIYNHLYPMYFGTGTNLMTVLMKVAFDLLIQTTLLTLPVAYGIKAMVYQYSFQEAFRRYIDDIRNHGLLMKYFTLWGPVQCLTFSIIPERYRIVFIAMVSFFWLIILSTISSRVRSSTTTTSTAGSNLAAATVIVTTTIRRNITDTTTAATFSSTPLLLSTQECELVDGLTCNIDG